MKYKVLIIILILGIIFYSLFAYLDYKSQLAKLEVYKFLKNEEILTTFKIKNKDYLITDYENETTSAGHHILFKENKKYYKLENLQNCNFEKNNIYINNNKIYIHCIGQIGNVIEYTIDNLTINKEIHKFNYKNTPNISQLHMSVFKADKTYIYLSSPFKVDNNIKDEPKVKCSLKNKKCEYY